MKHLIYTLGILLATISTVMPQSVTLTFTGQDTNGIYVQLDSVVINNLTKGWQETLYWPDTILTMTNTGIDDYEGSMVNNDPLLQFAQNNPNPFDGTTHANITMAKDGDISVEITDVVGRIVKTKVFSSLQAGTHQLHITLSTAGIYFLTARQDGQTSSIKMVNRSNSGTDDIAITNHIGTPFNASALRKHNKGHKGTTDNPFDIGDQMEYMGYITLHDSSIESEHIIQYQDSAQIVELLFDVDVNAYFPHPCPGTPTVTDVEGNIYNTLQIGNQCWMKENLRTSHYSDSTAIQIIQQNYYYSNEVPYCYYPNNNIQNLPVYGYLYNWPAVMHGAPYGSYSNPSGVQGICPVGWHVPSKDEWNIMESFFTDADVTADMWRGDHAFKLCTDEPNIWYTPDYAATIPDLNYSGFSVYPAGEYDCFFHNFGTKAAFWTTSTPNARRIEKYNPSVYSYGESKFLAFSLRCVKD